MIETANPFREGLARSQAPEPCLFVLFGATGDLAARKLIPALLQLAKAGLTPRQFYVLGVARKPKTDDEWRGEMRAAVDKHAREPVDDETWQRFSERLGYAACEFNDAAGYERLRDRMGQLDREWGTDGNRLFYLAVAPEFFTLITDHLHQVGLTSPETRHDGWTRVVVEKPFGHDLASARELSQHLRARLREEQIYRIDHYLGKETVQNLLTLRFGNGIFEPLWNRRYIDHVQITVAETEGMGRRGEFYDQTGALRDMVQNHMMQLLSLVAMEPPVAWDADAVRDEKAKVLRALPQFSQADVAEHVVRAQYAGGTVAGQPAPGYLEEAGVDRDSLTETFVALRLRLDTWRWSGVPFYLRHGKRLPKRATEVAIAFRRPPLSLFPESAGGGQNTLVLRIQPDDGMALSFVAKVPGTRLSMQQVKMDFNYGTAFATPSPEAYERLLLDTMVGDGTLFTRADEVEYAWRFVSAIQEGWQRLPRETMRSYVAGTWGPPAADALLVDGDAWRRL